MNKLSHVQLPKSRQMCQMHEVKNLSFQHIKSYEWNNEESKSPSS